MKLNQILAIEKGTKATAERALTDLHRKSQVATLYEGRERTYSPATEDGERLPAESQKLQVKSAQVLRDLQSGLAELFDITITKDVANLKAVADIVVNGNVLAKNVPVTYLLFLEKKLIDLHTFVLKLPVLDGAEAWTWDAGQGAFRTNPVETARTKKIAKAVVLYPATEQHPAQVKEVSEDIVAGYWKQIRYSAALTQDHKDALLERVSQLQNAVKFAREAANSVDADRQNISGALFGFILGTENK